MDVCTLAQKKRRALNNHDFGRTRRSGVSYSEADLLGGQHHGGCAVDVWWVENVSCKTPLLQASSELSKKIVKDRWVHVVLPCHRFIEVPSRLDDLWGLKHYRRLWFGA